MKKTQALFCHGPGTPEPFTVRPCALAEPQKGEIRVEIAATVVNPIDLRRSEGYGKRLFRLIKAAGFPLVLGNDFAGRVTAIGPDVTEFAVGDSVFGANPPSTMGTHATDTIAKVAHTLRAPAGRDPTSLAVLPYGFTTMWLAVAGAGLTRSNASGREVLVHGASGGLGMLALRLLSNWGARVTAVGWADTHDALIDAGAAIVLDARTRPFASLAPTFDATLNFATWDDDLALIACLRRDALGHATTVHPLVANFDRLGWVRGAIASIMAKRRHTRALPAGCKRYNWTLFRANTEALAELDRLLDHLHLPVGCVVNLADGASAFAHVHDKKPGRAVIAP